MGPYIRDGDSKAWEYKCRLNQEYDVLTLGAYEEALWIEKGNWKMMIDY